MEKVQNAYNDDEAVKFDSLWRWHCSVDMLLSVINVVIKHEIPSAAEFAQDGVSSCNGI